MVDFLIVGSGLFGSVFAHEMKKRNYKCTVIEKRKHIGGNIFSEQIEGIQVHKYGAHIFHTSDPAIWNYVNSFTPFHNFINSPIANYDGELFSLPFNMWTFNQLWNVITPFEARHKIEQQIIKIDRPNNLEEWSLSQVGSDIYQKLIYGYTKKQWGKDPKWLPASIIKRIPLRYIYDSNYFNDIYQGIPTLGYTHLINKLLEGIEVRLDTDFFENREFWESGSTRILYTGNIDRFYNYKFGQLEYRSLRFEEEVLDIENYQGVAVMNFTSEKIPYTRIIEHKHFDKTIKSSKTIISKEYPDDWDEKKIPYYPINDEKNNKIYKKYENVSTFDKKYLFGGRLAKYKYYDMHQIIASALKLVSKIIQEKINVQL